MGQGHRRLVLSLTVIRSPSPDLTVVGPDSASPEWPGGKFSFLLEFVGTTGTCSHTLSVRHSPRVRVPARMSHYQNAELLTKQSRQLLTFTCTHACPQTRGGPPPPAHSIVPQLPLQLVQSLGPSECQSHRHGCSWASRTIWTERLPLSRCSRIKQPCGEAFISRPPSSREGRLGNQTQQRL